MVTIRFVGYLFLLAIPAVNSFATSATKKTSINTTRRGIHVELRKIHRSPTTAVHSNLQENEESITLDPKRAASSSASIFDNGILPSFRKRFLDAAAEGFGTKARNVATSMSVGDIVVPICGNLELRQILANRGIYAGVEYEICELRTSDDGNEGGETVTTMEGLSPAAQDGATAKIKPAYTLRDYLERSDWPVEVNPVGDVPLWLSKTTYEAGTMLGTLGLSFTYLSVAAIAAFFVRFVYVPSPSMQPALNPGDVVVVTRTIWPLKPAVGSVVLFDPPSEQLSRVVLASAVAQQNGASLPNKGEQFLKRLVAKEGERVGVKNSNPYVELGVPSNDDSLHPRRRFRVDVVGPYAQPSAFSESSWNRSPEPLGKNKYFVAGDNGYRSVDSRVWGPLDRKNIFGEARWIVWPVEDFGPVKEGQISNIEK